MTLDEQLVEAAKNGNIEVAQEANVNAVGHYGITPLTIQIIMRLQI